MAENKKSMFDYMMEGDSSKPSVLSELLCCPFCGEKPKWWDSIDQLGKKWVHIQCQNAFCYVRPHICEPPEIATISWNKRAI